MRFPRVISAEVPKMPLGIKAGKGTATVVFVLNRSDDLGACGLALMYDASASDTSLKPVSRPARAKVLRSDFSLFIAASPVRKIG